MRREQFVTPGERLRRLARGGGLKPIGDRLRALARAAPPGKPLVADDRPRPLPACDKARHHNMEPGPDRTFRCRLCGWWYSTDSNAEGKGAIP